MTGAEISTSLPSFPLVKSMSSVVACFRLALSPLRLLRESDEKTREVLDDSIRLLRESKERGEKAREGE